jgi:V/A-type H+-transporting ATPase subunit F
MSAKQIGVMGPPDFVLGFNLAGVRRTFVTQGDFARQVEQLLHAREDLGILIVQGSDLESLPPLLKKKVNDSLDPVVVAMGEGAGEGDLREKVKRAIGIDLYKK